MFLTLRIQTIVKVMQILIFVKTEQLLYSYFAIKLKV
jgi:hypothetical protein